ncbi:FUSC family protein [Methylobacterium sp. NPDC080182]|uniref:FUSC family protein n=1 Tax=Methylobacterium sp. NPDC080182 TaxID=3390590 RepID=UPI003CFFBA08
MTAEEPRRVFDEGGAVPSGPVGTGPRGMRPLGLRGLLFVLRCSLSSTAAFLIASTLGLGHPVWALVSALIVSQESLAETHRSLGGRILGTLLGVTAAVAVHAAFRWSGLDTMAGQVAVITALCAVAARERPAIRVCMWTGPLVLLTATPEAPIGLTALHRGGEVILGGLVGGGMHSAIEWCVRQALDRGRPGDGGTGRAG